MPADLDAPYAESVLTKETPRACTRPYAVADRSTSTGAEHR